MKRRAALAVIASFVIAPSMAKGPRRIGMLQFRGGLMSREKPHGKAFIAAMRELGYSEGVDYLYDERLWQRQEELPEMVRDLVRLNTDLIIAAGPPSIVAARSATDRIPIVMMYSAEPVAMGLVRSLNRPGGNVTGLTWDHGFESNVKALELLKETLSGLHRVGLIWDATDSVHPVYAKYYAKAAPQLKLELISAPVRVLADIEPALARFKKERADALVVLPSGQLTVPKGAEILEMAMRERIPALYAYGTDRVFPNALLQHGPNLSAMPRRVAAYVHRILKGAKPAEIPIEQPDKYDLVVDLSVARKLGIAVPNSVRARADRVIE